MDSGSRHGGSPAHAQDAAELAQIAKAAILAGEVVEERLAC